MTEKLYPYIECIETLSKSPLLRDGDVFPFVRQVLIESSKALECERVNVWMLEEQNTVLANLLSYDRRYDKFELQEALDKASFPNYFDHLLVNEIIVADNAADEPKNSELVLPYILPNGIQSMIDIPLRSDGEMFGVICYERLKAHAWQADETKFVQSVAQLLSLALETQKRKKLQEYLQVLLDQKNILLAEIHHRTKNNSSIVLGIISLMKHKAKDEYHKSLFDQLSQRVFSFAAVQDQLSATDNFDRVDLAEYLYKLARNLAATYPNSEKIETSLNFEEVVVPLKQATSIGLIVNEAITNVYKYAFDRHSTNMRLLVELKRSNGRYHFIISDNGKGFNQNEKEHGLGFDLIYDLAEQMDAEITVNSMPGEGCTIELSFSPNN